MAERLALGAMPGTGWSAREIQTVAREAEDAGFHAVFTTEVNNDALATAQLLGTARRDGAWRQIKPLIV
jgi:alkanesulfonate monooxygenase SsuD/methylene tetrahydromethanopterin reductase-like flavin-dependent oxidoreductase (luciferase family)